MSDSRDLVRVNEHFILFKHTTKEIHVIFFKFELVHAHLDIVVLTPLYNQVKASSSSIVVRTATTHTISKIASLTAEAGFGQNYISAPLEMRGAIADAKWTIGLFI